MRAADLKTGSVYFMVTYEDAAMCRAITVSYEFLGRDPYGVPNDPSESRYYFKYLPAFRAGAEDESSPSHAETEIAEAPHLFTEQQLKSLLDIDGLIAELTSLRTRLSQPS